MQVESILDLLISPAHADAAAAAPQGGLVQLLPLVFLFVIMYFLMIRPQQKRAKEHRTMVDALKKGDEVVTSGGLLGKITDTDENFISVKLADNVEVKVQRQAVSTVMPKGTIKGK